MTYLQDIETGQVYLSRFPELNPSPILACGLDGVLQYSNPATLRLLQALKVDNIDDILPVKHRELVKTSRMTGTALTEKRKVAGRTIVWSYQPGGDSHMVYIYGYDISDYLSRSPGSEDLPEANPNPTLSSAADGVPQFVNPATSRLLRELNVKNIYDVLPIAHKGLTKACLKTNTPLSEQREIAGRTIVWSYHPLEKHDLVYIYGHELSHHD